MPEDKFAIILELEKLFNCLRLTLPENVEGDRMYGYTKTVIRRVQNMIDELPEPEEK
mgnify:CR=1|jgi:hypothetical protein|tara:strand:+ start:38 stop:208 length:171 start_codon:yes stop_codon:yes gene_type:complete